MINYTVKSSDLARAYMSITSDTSSHAFSSGKFAASLIACSEVYENVRQDFSSLKVCEKVVVARFGFIW